MPYSTKLEAYTIEDTDELGNLVVLFASWSESDRDAEFERLSNKGIDWHKKASRLIEVEAAQKVARAKLDAIDQLVLEA